MDTLDKFKYNNNVRKNWFTLEWWVNGRPGSHVVDANTIDVFKKRLDTFKESEVKRSYDHWSCLV